MKPYELICPSLLRMVSSDITGGSTPLYHFYRKPCAAALDTQKRYHVQDKTGRGKKNGTKNGAAPIKRITVRAVARCEEVASI